MQNNRRKTVLSKATVDDDDDAAAPVTSTDLPTAAAVIDVDAELPAPPGGDSDMEDIDEDVSPHFSFSFRRFLTRLCTESTCRGRDFQRPVS